MRPSRTAQARKDELISGFRQARQELLEAALAIPGDQCHTPFLGTWSVNDIVAHLAGWDYANLEAIQSIQAGRLPGFYAHYDPDWRTFNAGLVAQHMRATLAETLAVTEAAHGALLEALAALSPAEISRDRGVRSPRGRRVTIGMLLTAETRDEHKHCAQIREYAAGRQAAGEPARAASIGE